MFNGISIFFRNIISLILFRKVSIMIMIFNFVIFRDDSNYCMSNLVA